MTAAISATTCRADIVSISTSAPSGTESALGTNDYIGIIDSLSPIRINGQNVTINRRPSGESVLVGDLAGRDIDATSGSRTWEYSLSLPANSVDGTGFTNINFSAHSFERRGNNLEGTDQVSWQLFLNGVSAGTTGPAAGTDWTSYDTTLTNIGGNSINDIRVVFTVSGFNSNDEWFVTRGTLSADYTSVPESSISLLGFLGIAVFWRRRNE